MPTGTTQTQESSQLSDGEIIEAFIKEFLETLKDPEKIHSALEGRRPLSI